MKRRYAVWVLVLAHIVSAPSKCHSQANDRSVGSNRDDASTVDLKERDELLAKAAASVKAAAPKVADDPSRPIFHVLAPANWINDPNGPIQHGGYYHLFYQHNPYGDAWGNMHWGHVRSRDLVHWEHLPIALWPSKSKGEEHCFSGCATFTKNGQLMLFYTSIGNRLPEQWAAVPVDDELINWRKHAANPLLTEKLHGDTKVSEWRDPFVFHHDGRTYLVCGGNLNKSGGGQAVVLVYRAENGALTEWKYLGELFRHPDAAVKNIECPLFFPLADGKGEKRWVLIVSPHGPVEYFVGGIDSETMKFKADSRGIVDHGSFYAPNVMFDKQGRCLLWGWIRDFPGGKGWNGCLTVPRVLSLDGNGRLVQQPAEELKKLIGETRAVINSTDLVDRPASLSLQDTRAYRLRCTIHPDGATAFRIAIPHNGDDKRAIAVRYDGRELDVAGKKAPLKLGDSDGLDLAVFVDHSVLEVYANGTACVSRVIPVGERRGDVQITAEGGVAKLKLAEMSPMRTIWQKAAASNVSREGAKLAK
jgi:beta-fructofuranosidase